MTFSDYMDYLRGKRIGVIGFGVSNQPLVRVLLRNGCDVTVCDRRDRAQLGATGDEAAAQGAKFILGADYLEHLDFDVIFRTPGVLPIVPQLRKAAQSGAILTSEMEAFCNLCPCRIIAITGNTVNINFGQVIGDIAAGGAISEAAQQALAEILKAFGMTQTGINAILTGFAGSILTNDQIAQLLS